MLTKKTVSTDPTQTALVSFGFYFKSQPNQTKPHAFLSCGSDDFSPQNRTKPHRKHP